MKLNKSFLKRIISGSFAFLLSLVFVVLYVCLGFGFGAFNDRALSRKINESNYYNKVYQELKVKSEAIVTEAGLPVSVLTEVITLERVYIAGQNYVDAAFDNKEFKIKTDKLRDKLTDNIYQYLMDEGLVLTDELDAGIEEVISAIETDYKDGIQLQFLNYVMDYRAEYIRLMMIMIPILIVLCGVLCYFLIRMQKYPHKGVRYIVYAILSSSLMTILAASYLLLMKQYTKVKVVPDYYQSFLAEYLKWDITVFVYIGGIGIILSIVLISLISFLKSQITHN